MGHAPADISAKVFKPASLTDSAKYALDHRMLAVLLEFDGQRTLADIGSRLKMEMAELHATALRLQTLGLIESVSGQNRLLKPADIELLTEKLARAIGPLAVVLVEEELLSFGYSRENFPAGRLQALVDRLATNIRKNDKQSEFRAAVAALLRQNQ